MPKLQQIINTFTTMIFIVVLCLFSSCNDDVFSSDPNLRLSFSADTINFELSFSGVTGSTRRVIVYNRNNNALRISDIGLAGGANSPFRINVNGAASANNRFSNVEISARDSMFIFLNVNVPELGQDAPEFIEDYIFFNLNDRVQRIVLETYGQNVEFLRGLTIQSDSTLTANIPYIIFDSLVVTAGKTLTLEPGTRLFFHNNAEMIVRGNLIAEGTAKQPILMRGSRFDALQGGNLNRTPVPYNFISGQWRGLFLLGNGTHRMAHVNMNSGMVGIFLSANSDEEIPNPTEMPSLELSNSRVHNFLFYGLHVQNANVTVANTEISNTGNHTVFLNGGTHTFVHTTIANFFNVGNSIQPRGRSTFQPAVMIENMNRSAPMKTVFLNSAIAGSAAMEFSLATRFPEEFAGIFRNTYIKRSPLELPQFSDIRWHEQNDTIFRSTALNLIQNQFFNFEPDSVSPLRGLADTTVISCPEFARFNLRFDLNGNDRTESDRPASGAFEWRSPLNPPQGDF
jgi:predicted phosphodiesterase